MANAFVSTEWLQRELGADDLVVIDASWHMPAEGRSGEAEYLQEHIPGAVHFDIDAVADHSIDLPHMLPSLPQFEAQMAALGISENMRVVVYDSLGLFTAPRVWWTLRVFGMREISILEGGLPKWKAEGRALEAGPVSRAPARFNARFDRSLVVSVDEVLQASQSGAATIVDARAVERFNGAAPEPRPGLHRGHIPGSHNVPWTTLIADGRLVAPHVIADTFARAGVDAASSRIITSCGSGVSAAILSLALAQIGMDSAVYDGSWSEWGARDDLPRATG